LGTEAADEATLSSGPATWDGQDDGGDVDVDHAYATPERTCKDKVKVTETSDTRQHSEGRGLRK
jgi:hypothetical protein